MLLLLMLGPYSNHTAELEDILDLPDNEAPTLSSMLLSDGFWCCVQRIMARFHDSI